MLQNKVVRSLRDDTVVRTLENLPKDPGLQMAVTPVPLNISPSAGPKRHCMQMVYRQTCRFSYIHIKYIKFKQTRKARAMFLRLTD